MSDVRESVGETGWSRFWNRGGWWKALGVAAVYYALYQGYGLLVGLLFGHLVDPDNVLANPQTVFFEVGLPILLGGITLLIFVWSLGWLREIFGPQPIKGSGWMWIAVVLVVVPIALRVAGTDWSAHSVAVVLTMLLSGLFIGFAEEVLTRGLAVNLLRRAGYGEKAVMLLSSVVFALLHSGNILTGQSPLAVGITVVYAFGFGLMMYLVLRVTGSIVWPILLHAATDPTTMLATGGIDSTSATAGSEVLLGVAGLFNFVYLGFGLLAIIFVKGKVYPNRSPRGRAGGEPPASTTPA